MKEALNESLSKEQEELLDEEDEYLDSKTNNNFIYRTWADDFIEQESHTDLIEIYKLKTFGYKEDIKFYIFFPIPKGTEKPSWYPSKVTTDKIYIIMGEDAIKAEEFYRLPGFDKLKKLIIEDIQEFI